MLCKKTYHARGNEGRGEVALNNSNNWNYYLHIVEICAKGWQEARENIKKAEKQLRKSLETVSIVKLQSIHCKVENWREIFNPIVNNTTCFFERLEKRLRIMSTIINNFPPSGTILIFILKLNLLQNVLFAARLKNVLKIIFNIFLLFISSASKADNKRIFIFDKQNLWSLLHS